jgi:hypothetical protein
MLRYKNSLLERILLEKGLFYMSNFCGILADKTLQELTFKLS